MFTMFFFDKIEKKGHKIVSISVEDGLEIVIYETPNGVRKDFAENGEVLIFNSGY